MTKEVTAVVLPKSLPIVNATPATQKPMSAIAARRAAREMAAKTPLVEIEQEDVSDMDEDLTYSAVSELEGEEEDEEEEAEGANDGLLYGEAAEQVDVNDQEADASADQRKARRGRRRNVSKTDTKAVVNKK